MSRPPAEEKKIYPTIVDAIRAVAEEYGDGAYRTCTFAIPKDKWPQLELFIQKHGRRKVLEMLLCLIAEAS